MFWCTLKKKQYENIRNGYKELRRKAPHFWLWMQSLPLPTGSQCLCHTRQMLDRCPPGPLRRQDRLRVYSYNICYLLLSRTHWLCLSSVHDASAREMSRNRCFQVTVQRIINFGLVQIWSSTLLRMI